jgi:hypothetical protein
MRVQLNCSLKAYDVKPGDTVALTLARYGWTAKLFTVTERRHDWSTQTVQLSLRETASTVWDWAFGAATAVDLTPNTSLPNPFAKPPALAGLTALSGTAYLQQLRDGTIQCRALVSWTQSADIYVVKGGTIEVKWARADTGVWVQAQPLPGDAASTLVGPLEEGYVHIIGLRAVSQIGKQGPWSFVGLTAAGKSVAPANVGGYVATVVQGGVSILWEASTEADYAYTELRRGATWSTATALDGSAIASKPTRVSGSYYHWAWPTAGSYTLWAAHVDASGNVSAVPQSFAVTVGTNGLVQTVGIAPSAATDVVTASGGAGSAVQSVIGSNVFVVTAGVPYTNPLAGPIQVTISYTARGFTNAFGSGSAGSADLSLQWSSPAIGGGVGHSEILAAAPVEARTMKAVITLPGGATLSWSIQAGIQFSFGSGSGVSMSWTRTEINLEAIKV